MFFQKYLQYLSSQGLQRQKTLSTRAIYSPKIFSCSYFLLLLHLFQTYFSLLPCYFALLSYPFSPGLCTFFQCKDKLHTHTYLVPILHRVQGTEMSPENILLRSEGVLNEDFWCDMSKFSYDLQKSKSHQYKIFISGKGDQLQK